MDKEMNLMNIIDKKFGDKRGSYIPVSYTHLMDEIFGEDNFVNEIIWHYKSGGSGKRHFSRKHDTILVYSKTKKYYFSPDKEKSYNRGFKPYRFKGVKAVSYTHLN